MEGLVARPLRTSCSMVGTRCSLFVLLCGRRLGNRVRGLGRWTAPRHGTPQTGEREMVHGRVPLRQQEQAAFPRSPMSPGAACCPRELPCRSNFGVFDIRRCTQRSITNVKLKTAGVSVLRSSVLRSSVLPESDTSAEQSRAERQSGTSTTSASSEASLSPAGALASSSGKRIRRTPPCEEPTLPKGPVRIGAKRGAPSSAERAPALREGSLLIVRRSSATSQLPPGCGPAPPRADQSRSQLAS